MEKIRGVLDELIRVYGVAPDKKPEGITEILYKSWCNIIIKDNKKLEKAKEICDELEMSVVAYNKHMQAQIKQEWNVIKNV